MSKKVEVIASQFLARYQVHQLRIFIWENWEFLFGLLPDKEIDGKTPRSNKTQNFISNYTVPEDAGGASRWSRVALENNAGISKADLVYMRDHPTEIVSVNPEPNKFSSEHIYERIIDWALKSFKRAFEWDSEAFVWRFGVHSKKSWPLVDVLRPDLLSGYAGSSWYLYKYKIWEGKEGIERMILTIGKMKDELGFYAAAIHGIGLDDEAVELYTGLAFLDTVGRTVLLLKDFQGAFANLVLFTDNANVFFDAEIAIGHFSYLSLGLKVQKNLTKMVVLTKQDPESVVANGLICAPDIAKDDITERAVAYYLRDKKSSRLSSIREPIYSKKYFTKWVEQTNGVSFRDEEGDAKGGE